MMPSKYVKKGESPEGKERRLRAFKHNGYVGHARMMQMQTQAIMNADSATRESKEIAFEINQLAAKLAGSLKIRKD
jgi:hypothetical protein